MADLQLCYFCESGPDSSLGEYSVVPPDLDPSPEQQQSVVLCRDCREKLTTVMQPVVEAASEYAEGGTGPGEQPTGAGDQLGGGQQSGGQQGGGQQSGGQQGGGPQSGEQQGGGQQGGGLGATSGSDQGGGLGDVAGDEADASGSSGEDQGTVGGSWDDTEFQDASGGTDSPTGDDGGPDESAGGGASSGQQPDGPSGGGQQPGGSSSGGGQQPGGSSSSGGGQQPGGSSGGGTAGGGSDSGGPPPDSNAKRDQPHADDELVGRNNEAYNKTLRLLQNREFPVERHEIEQVAANAYQLDPQEVSNAIDALINKGLLSQEGAQLIRT